MALVLVSVGVFFIRWARADRRVRSLRGRRVLAIILLVNELSWHVWNLAFGAWTVTAMLPLQLCSIMIWMTVWALIRGKAWIYPAIYFLGIAGALQAIITPDAGIYGFPHFRFFQTMIAHGSLVLAGFWVVLVEGYRPDRKASMSVFGALNIYAILVYIVNRLIGSNYLYLISKPEVPSVLDFFPAWPWYLVLLELTAVVVLWLMYLPFSGGSGPVSGHRDLQDERI